MSDKDYWTALEKALHALFHVRPVGLFHTALIDIFHSTQRAVPMECRPYLLPPGHRAAASFSGTPFVFPTYAAPPTAWPISRIVVTLDEIRRDVEKHVPHLFSLRQLAAEQARNFYLESLLGDYLLSAGL